MTISYKIDENDFLTHQLYVASKSERIKKKRKRNKIIIPLIYFAFALLFFREEKYLLTVSFSIIGFLWFFVYPIWERRRYVRHYESFIKENYTDRLGRVVTLEFSNDYILGTDNGSESKILTKELLEICEIPSTIFIRLKGGQSFILPKDKIANIDEVKVRLLELTSYLKIKYETYEKWEWK